MHRSDNATNEFQPTPANHPTSRSLFLAVRFPRVLAVRAWVSLSLWVVATCLLLAPNASHAGIYSVDDWFPFEIDNDVVQPLQYTGGLNVMLSDLRNLPTPTSTLAARMRERITQRRQRGVESLTSDELASYTADMLRLNQLEVLNTLQPLARDPRRGGFFVNAHMAVAFAARGDFREAYEHQLAAVSGEFPTKFGKLVSAQLGWYKRVERNYYLPWLKARSGPQPKLENATLDPLFAGVGLVDKTLPPVQFVYDDGQYIAGKIAVAEKKKLPPDALAIVQQMVLWHPNDFRLHWLLAELYNADGDLDTALSLLNLCVEKGYSPALLKDHRRTIQTAVEAIQATKTAERLAQETRDAADREAAERSAIEERKRRLWIITIAIAGGVLLLYLQGREIIRRVRRWR